MTDDQPGMQQRLRSLLPRWFPDASPILDGVLAGLAAGAAFLRQLTAYAALQARIKTATDGWLDLIADDFFGGTLVRAVGQADESFRSRILANLLRERVTRRALEQVLTDLTGTPPVVVEPMRPADTGGYGSGGVGYGVAGAYGSLLMPLQCLVRVKRPPAQGIPDVAGYGVPTGGYGEPSRAVYASLADVQGAVTDADILSAVESVRPAGTTVWVNIAA